MTDYVINRCTTKNGTFGTLQMLLSQDVDVVFGPICSRGILFSYLCVSSIQLAHGVQLYIHELDVWSTGLYKLPEETVQQVNLTCT